MTGRKVELGEVVEPSHELESSVAPKVVHVTPTPIREESNDDDHETSVEVTMEPRRLMRTHTTPVWYDPVMSVMLVNNTDDPATNE